MLNREQERVARRVANQFVGALVGATLFIIVLSAATTHWGMN